MKEALTCHSPFMTIVDHHWYPGIQEGNKFRNKIHSPTGLLGNTGNQWDHWIGLTKFNDRETFEWSDSTPMAFTYWRDGEPNGGGDATEGCVEMYSYSAGTDWNDNQCNNTIQFICEKQSTEYRYPYLPSPECTFYS